MKKVMFHLVRKTAWLSGMILSLSTYSNCSSEMNGFSSSQKPKSERKPQSEANPDEKKAPETSTSDTNKDKTGGVTDLESFDGFMAACQKGNLTHIKETIVYPASKGCRWNVDGNFGKVNGRPYNARREELKTISIPATQRICEFSLSSLESQLYYDDALYLTVNNAIILGSMVQPFIPKDPVIQNLYIWDWSKIGGGGPPWAPLEKICFGSKCDLPPTQTTGKLNFVMGPQKGFEFTKYLKEKSSLDIKLITTGDDDATKDCSHSLMTFNVDISTVAK